MCAIMPKLSYKWCIGGLAEGHLCSHMFCLPIHSRHVKWVVWQACLSGYSQKAFFYQFDLDTGAAKIHTCTHAHIRPHTCKWFGARVACMLGNQVTSNPSSGLLCSSSPSSRLSIIFCHYVIPLTVSCPHLSRIYSPRGAAGASCRAPTCISSKIPWGLR